MKKIFKIKVKLWRWPGDMGWHFVNVDKRLSEKIRTKYPKGFVKIRATVGKTTWNTSLFPHKNSGAYLLAIKQGVRKNEGIFTGDTLVISFSIVI